MSKTMQGKADPSHDTSTFTVTRVDGTIAQIQLPIVARMGIDWGVPLIAGLGILLTGAGVASIVWLILLTLISGHPTAFSESFELVFVAMIPGLGLYGFLKSLASHISDHRNGQNVIVIRDDSFWDRRETTKPVPWAIFHEAEVIAVQTFCVRLRARMPIPNRRPHRLRMLEIMPRTYSPELDVTLPWIFDHHEDDLAFAIAEMVKRHGGRAILRKPFSTTEL